MSETDETPPQSPRGRRGSETRQRNATLSLRLTDDEAAQVSAAADRAGLTVGSYVRTLALGSPGLRAARRPVVDRQQLTQVLGEIGRLGSNVNQLAKAFNTDASTPEAMELAEAQAHIQAMRAAVMEALGRRA